TAALAAEGRSRAAPNHYGAPLRGHFRMGLSDMEARFLSGETCAEKLSELLRFETECRRSQLHLPPMGKTDDRPDVDCRNARAFPLQHQGAPVAHAHQAIAGRAKILDALSRHAESIKARRAAGPVALSVAAEFQSGPGTAFRVSEKLAAKCARGV